MSRTASPRTSRRRVLSVGASGAAAILLAACSATTTTTSTSTAGGSSAGPSHAGSAGAAADSDATASGQPSAGGADASAGAGAATPITTLDELATAFEETGLITADDHNTVSVDGMATEGWSWRQDPDDGTFFEIYWVDPATADQALLDNLSLAASGYVNSIWPQNGGPIWPHLMPDQRQRDGCAANQGRWHPRPSGPITP